MQQARKVLFAKISINGGRKFTDILLSDDVKKFIIPYNGKDLEISHVNNTERYITGIFVATQKTDIPPVHTPGEDDDYSAVELADGKGFAFPNVFLYCKDNGVLCYEVNRLGFSEKTITYYFNRYSELKCDADFSFEMASVLNIDPVKRTKSLLKINEIEMQIASPLNYLSSKAIKDGSFSDIAKVVEKTNATKGISIKIMASDDKPNRINKNETLKMIRNFLSLPHNSKERVRDKMIISGVTQNEDNITVPDIINVMLNNLEGYFNIEKHRIAKNLQIPERKNGIESVYKRFYNDIKANI